MSSSYHALAFTEGVLDAQVRYGSRPALARLDRMQPPQTRAGHGEDKGPAAQPVAALPRDALTADERGFLAELDAFYLATVSSTGWPYVQFRGGPAGFIRTPDEHTIAWADFRGNRQYLSTGNLAGEARVAMIFLDHPRRLRLKVFGTARVHDTSGADGRASASSLGIQGYRAKVEREVRVDVWAYDWNCPQHIVPRYTVEELAPALEALRQRVTELEAENQRLRQDLHRPRHPSP
jgi:predicted pyridoxine 5'-phosphate oxidase superfamily flavin-nucleotide-binding protein